MNLEDLISALFGIACGAVLGLLVLAVIIG